MSWHYRIGKQTDHGEVYYHLIRAYTDDEGKPWGWEHASLSYMENWSTIIQTLEWMMLGAGKHDILDLDAPMPGKGPGVDDDV